MTQLVDARGTRCPMPLLKAKQALKKIAVGDRIKILATDPAAHADFKAMLRHLPHELESFSSQADESGEYTSVDVFIIRKGE
jgi:tRNA 2-thiouridine synthesizing protein A